MDRKYFFWFYASPDNLEVFEVYRRVGGAWYTTANQNTGEFPSLWYELTRKGSFYRVRNVLL
jgi:hypothetical protein